jgi:hypothetical protein
MLSPETAGLKRLVARLRYAPFGILLIAALLAIGGIGSIAGGIFLILQDGSLTPWAAVISIFTGPAAFYLAYHLVALERWTWLALLFVVGLLFLSSVLRLAVSPGLSLAPLAEIAIEITAALYLLRAAIRESFGSRA